MSTPTELDTWQQPNTDYGITIVNHLAAISRSFTELQQRQSNVPADRLVSGNVLIAAGATTGAVDLGGPQQGRVRVFRAIRVGGLTPTTTAAGRCDIFQSQNNPLLNSSIGLERWLDQATSLPLVAGYGNRQIVIRWPDRVWAVFSSATASQVYVANAEIEEYEEGGYLPTVDL